MVTNTHPTEGVSLSAREGYVTLNVGAHGGFNPTGLPEVTAEMVEGKR